MRRSIFVEKHFKPPKITIHSRLFSLIYNQPFSRRFYEKLSKESRNENSHVIKNFKHRNGSLCTFKLRLFYELSSSRSMIFKTFFLNHLNYLLDKRTSYSKIPGCLRFFARLIYNIG